MAVTIDTRPTVFGDRLIVTGTYEAGDAIIDLSSQLANIDAFMLNPTDNHTIIVDQVTTINGDATGLPANKSFTLTDFGLISGDTSIGIFPPVKSVTTKAGTFLAIGRRS
tara:strand:- start:233 stop:562 length:330 start_codon:yes stop_codon:yes gene_type:complete